MHATALILACLAWGCSAGSLLEEPAYQPLASAQQSQLRSRSRLQAGLTSPLSGLAVLLLASGGSATAWQVTGHSPSGGVNNCVGLAKRPSPATGIGRSAWLPHFRSDVSMLHDDLVFEDGVPLQRSSLPAVMARRDVVSHATSAFLVALGAAMLPPPALALIKGVEVDPEKMKMKKKPKCTNIQTCREEGEQIEKEMFANQRTDFERTPGGDRYRDLTVGEGSKAVKAGDTIDIRYRVMRLGKRANDGLSGAGQTIFSYGFGEDEDKEGDSLTVQLAGTNLVPGINDGVIGMKPGGRRRILVRPERGWKAGVGQSCAKEVFMDPEVGAQVVDETACMNKVSLPQPQTYGAKARFGRRFDESLLVELDVVGFADAVKKT